MEPVLVVIISWHVSDIIKHSVSKWIYKLVGKLGDLVFEAFELKYKSLPY